MQEVDVGNAALLNQPGEDEHEAFFHRRTGGAIQTANRECDEGQKEPHSDSTAEGPSQTTAGDERGRRSGFVVQRVRWGLGRYLLVVEFLQAC